MAKGKIRSLRKRRACDDNDGVGENVEGSEKPSANSTLQQDSAVGSHDDEEEDEPAVDPIALKMLQKQRHRQAGMDVSRLISGKLSAGSLASQSRAEVEEGKTVAYSSFQTTFSASREDNSNKQITDKEMEEYIEKEISKTLGKGAQTSTDRDNKNAGRSQKKSIDDLALEACAPKARDQSTEPSSLVTAVTEVSIPFEHKVRNIEALETMKAQMLGIHGAPSETENPPLSIRSQFPSQFGKRKKKH